METELFTSWPAAILLVVVGVLLYRALLLLDYALPFGQASGSARPRLVLDSPGAIQRAVLARQLPIADLPATASRAMRPDMRQPYLDRAWQLYNKIEAYATARMARVGLRDLAIHADELIEVLGYTDVLSPNHVAQLVRHSPHQLRPCRSIR